MNKSPWALFVVALLMIAATAAGLQRLQVHQRLGVPGVKTIPIPGSIRQQVELPELVLDYSSTNMETDQLVLDTLPQDTSFGQRRYRALDGFEAMINVVLMGQDRSSMHKPQFCLEGAGWHIDQASTRTTTIHVDRPVPYDLPVVRLIADGKFTVKGQPVIARCVYVYWFVTDGELSASVSGFERMWKMSREFLLTGIWQRWAYVSCLAVCAPGQEEKVFERQKKLIAAAVPEFQLTPRPLSPPVAARN
jgi:hypothetical protein